DTHDGFVRNEQAATHIAIRLAPECRAVRHCLAQEITGSEDRDTESARKRGRLRPLACPRSSEQDDDRHDLRRAANLAADPRVVASGGSLTHLEVRSLPSSAPPSARLA